MNNVITRAYKDGVLSSENFPLDDVSELLKDESNTVWVDFISPNKDQLELMATELQLHKLAVEDALGSHQRPKVDYYANHLFLACHAVEIDKVSGELFVTEIFYYTVWRMTG